MSKVIMEPASDKSKEELVAKYKTILQQYINLRPSGTRMKIAQALQKNKSFVSQITNPTYAVPIPALHLNVIFDICRFSSKEREKFLKAYTAAHRNYQYRVEPDTKSKSGRRILTIEIPVIKDSVKQKQIESMIKDYARQLFSTFEN